jgi:hypothetical protein
MKTSFLNFLSKCFGSPSAQLDLPRLRRHQLKYSNCLLAVSISILPIVIISSPTYGDPPVCYCTDRTITPNPIQIDHQKLIISTELQAEIISQIPELDRKNQKQFQLFSIPINQQINLVYVHQGQDDWNIKFTYGGYLLNTTDETIYTTQEILKLKQDFRSIEKIYLADKTYATNGLMQQIGPSLHDRVRGDLTNG